MMVTNREVRKRLNIKADLMQTVMKRKLGLFVQICRMEDSRKIKSVMLRIMDGKGRRGRPNREWIDDIKEWCKKDLYSLTISMKFALDTYQPMDHGDCIIQDYRAYLIMAESSLVLRHS